MSDINLIIAELLNEGILAPPGKKGIVTKTLGTVAKAGSAVLNPVSTAGNVASKIGQLPGIRQAGAVAHTALNPVSAAGNVASRVGQLPGIRHVGAVANAALNPISTAKAGLNKAGSFASRF